MGHPLGNGPPLSRKAASGTWVGGLCKPETISWKSMCPFKDKNLNRTETHSCTYCMWGKFKNRNAWEPGNRDCKSCTPPKCESSGWQKAFSAFALLNLQYILVISICCAFLFLHLHFCAFVISLFYCMFFPQLLFVCIFKINLFTAFFQDSNFLR